MAFTALGPQNLLLGPFVSGWQDERDEVFGGGRVRGRKKKRTRGGILALTISSQG